MVNILFIVLMLFTGSVYAYDLPQRLWYKQAGFAESKWADKYTWIHDQNGDGCDELLVTHNPFNTWDHEEVITPNVVEMYFGGADKYALSTLYASAGRFFFVRRNH